MRLEKARPLVQEIALSGFGEDEEVAGRRKRRMRRRRRRRKRRGRRQGVPARPKARAHRPLPSETLSVEDEERRRRHRAAIWHRQHRLRAEPDAYVDDDFFEDEPTEKEWADALEGDTMEETRIELGRAVRRGLLSPGSARRVMQRIRARAQERRSRRQARRQQKRRQREAPPRTEPSVQPVAVPITSDWNPPGAMGNNLQVQARAGHRAAVMELREGLYLVADVSSQAVMPSAQGDDFGVVLPALMVRAASRALQRRRARREAREQNALRALRPRQIRGPSPQAAPLQLTGPIAGIPWSD